MLRLRQSGPVDSKVEADLSSRAFYDSKCPRVNREGRILGVNHKKSALGTLRRLNIIFHFMHIWAPTSSNLALSAHKSGYMYGKETEVDGTYT